MVQSKGRIYTARELLDIEALASTALERLAPVATQIDWLFAHLRANNPRVSVGATKTNKMENARPGDSTDLRVLLAAALGGAVIEVGQKFAGRIIQNQDGWLEELRTTADGGVRHGFKALGEELGGEATKLLDAARELELATRPA
jgi:hypothetical protein